MRTSFSVTSQCQFAGYSEIKAIGTFTHQIAFSVTVNSQTGGRWLMMICSFWLLVVGLL
jgi:hypothetical protein